MDTKFKIIFVCILSVLIIISFVTSALIRKARRQMLEDENIYNIQGRILLLTAISVLTFMAMTAMSIYLLVYYLNR